MRPTRRTVRYSALLALTTQLVAVAGGASLTAQRLAADGVVATNLSCNLTSGGMFGLMAVIAGLASKKAALDKCLPNKATVSVTWSAQAESIATVSSTSGDSAARTCVEKALTGTRGLPSGDCTATIGVE